MVDSQERPDDDATLVAAWLQHSQDHQDTHFWAWYRVNEIVNSDPQHGFALVLALADQASDEVIGSVGAGPLEDLVRTFHEQVVPKLEQAAREHPRLVEALCRIWLSQGAVPAETEARLQKLTGGRILVLNDY
jgi:hypothetical protein